jgi:hypothetical protein
MRAPGELLARYQHCGGISTHIAESASKPPGIERAIVGNLRRLEAHEAFIDMTLNAFEVRWWGAKGAKAGLRVSMILDGGWTATQLPYVRSRQSKVQLPLTTACAMLQRGKASEGRQSSSEDEEVAEVLKTKMDVILGVGGQFQRRVAGGVDPCWLRSCG